MCDELEMMERTRGRGSSCGKKGRRGSDEIGNDNGGGEGGLGGGWGSGCACGWNRPFRPH